MRVFLLAVALFCFALGSYGAQSDSGAPFIPHPVATDIYGGAQLIAADVNNDGKPDLIALGRQMSQLVWFENPFWQRRAIVHGTGGMAHVAASDIDGDGIPEIALAYGYGSRSRPETGQIAVLQHLGDPRGIWMMKNIHTIASERQLFFADVEGVGQSVLVDAPSLSADAHLFSASNEQSAQLIFYRPNEWMEQSMTLQGRDRMHQVLISNSGDVVGGTLGGTPFFSAVTAGQLMTYRQDGAEWKSSIVDATLKDGRVLLTADINRDGAHEIIATGPGNKIYLYRSANAGTQWQCSILDDTMGAAQCVSADLNADQKPDIACIAGLAPFSVHWYQNVSD